MISVDNDDFQVRLATVEDVPIILQFIKALADYERLPHLVVATEELLKETLFGKRQVAEVILGFEGLTPVAFALYFHNFSTFLGLPGIYLEDLFVNPEYRRKGHGKKMLTCLAEITVERKCGRLEWSVLDWNEPAIDFYQKLGAQPMNEWTMFRLTGNELNQLAGQNKS
jgi:GNAT superfamily N-acetyltransferase